MNNYKLYIETVNGWTIADLGNDVPALNYQTNNIAELKDRQSDYSQQLKLPITPTNCQVFGVVGEFNVINTNLYKRLNCRLFCDEHLLAGTGSYIIVTKVSDYIYTQILSGNSTFFSLLDVPMKAVDLGYINRNQAACDPANFGDKYVFAAATFIKGGAPIYQSALNHNFPFVNFKTAITKLITDKGYSLDTNLSDSDWDDIYLSLTSDKSDFDEYYGKAIANIVRSDTEYIFNVLFDVLNNASGKLSSSGSMMYQAPFECSVNLNANITSSNCYNVRLVMSIYNIYTSETTVLYDIDSPTHRYNNNLNLIAGDLIQVYSIAFKDPAVTATVNASVEFTMQPMNVPYNEKLPFNVNLGFANQIDLFKAFTQLFGITVNVEEKTKVVHAFTMKKIYDNKGQARDWSDKLDTKTKPEMSFTLDGYGQENIIKFIDNETDSVKESISFVCLNQMLEKTKELFTLPFESGLDNYVGGNFVANIPLEQITDTEITMQGGKPHIVRISGSTISYTIGSTAFNYKKAVHVKLAEMNVHYAPLAKMLLRPIYSEVMFNLNDMDIEQHDSFIPVYVQKFGSYFYVNKIVNYISGKLTKCQIIKL